MIELVYLIDIEKAVGTHDHCIAVYLYGFLYREVLLQFFKDVGSENTQKSILAICSICHRVAEYRAALFFELLDISLVWTKACSGNDLPYAVSVVAAPFSAWELHWTVFVYVVSSIVFLDPAALARDMLRNLFRERWFPSHIFHLTHMYKIAVSYV